MSEEWKPSMRLSVLWNLLGLMLAVIGFVVFGVIAAFAAGGSVELAGLDPIWGIVLVLAGVIVTHELIHGAAMLMFGARPTFGAALVQKVMPVVYCTSPGHLFTRGQFMVVALAPAVVLSVVGVALMPFGNLASWLMIPLALNLGGAIGDFWMTGMLLRREPDVLVEDLHEGLRFHYRTP